MLPWKVYITPGNDSQDKIQTRIYVYETLCPNRYEPSIEVIVKMGVRPGEGGWLVARLGWCGVNAKKGVRLGGSGWM